MKAKSYKLKYIPTTEQLIKLGARPGGTWFNQHSEWYISFIGEFPDSCGDFSIYIGFPNFEESLEEWDDFSYVLVLDDDFGQPYTPFYGKNYKKDVQDFPYLEFVIEKYNEFMDGFDFLCENFA